jgi:DNA-binding MarR family transcriptional regulator
MISEPSATDIAASDIAATDIAPEPPRSSSGLVPSYVLDHGDPAALFTRLQRVVIHLELLQQESMRGFDITFRDFVILATLRKEPSPHELAVSQIADYVLRPMGSMTEAVDRVERAGLVVRRNDPDDRRKVLVSLTALGTRFANEALDAYNATRERLFERLSPDELEQIDEAVTTLLRALDVEYEEAHR